MVHAGAPGIEKGCRGWGSHTKAELGVGEVCPAFAERSVLERGKRWHTRAPDSVGGAVQIAIAGSRGSTIDEKVEPGNS